MGLLDTTSGGGRLAGGLGSELLAGGLSSGRLAGGLLLDDERGLAWSATGEGGWETVRRALVRAMLG